MVAHVDNLTKRHDKNVAELEEAKKAIQQQNPCRTFTDPRASPGLLTPSVSSHLSCSCCNIWPTAWSVVVDPDDSDSRRRSYQQVRWYLACCTNYLVITSIWSLFVFSHFSFIRTTAVEESVYQSFPVTARYGGFFSELSPFFTNVVIQKHWWVSLSLQEKIMRQLSKRAKERGSSDKKSGRSQSASSESSCSAINKDDSYTADDRSARDSHYLCHLIN